MISSITGSSGVYQTMDWKPTPPDRDKMFQQADSSGDGTLDKTELKSFLDKMPKGPQGPGTTIDAEEAFTVSDTNEDGVLTEEEFFTGGEKMREKMGMDKPPMMQGMQGMQGMNQSNTQSLLEMLSSTDSTTEDSTGTTGDTSAWGTQTLSQYIQSLLGNYSSGTGVLSTGTYSLNVTG